MDNISKERMIELVMGSPNGATHWSTSVCTYYRNLNGGWSGFHKGWFETNTSNFIEGNLIKLDYSVIKANADDKQIPDEAPIHKMLADTGAFIAQGGKPVYTQAQDDAGEMPPVGSRFILDYNEKDSRYNDMDGAECKMIGVCESSLNTIFTFHSNEHGYGAMALTSENCTVIDTRTEQEKLVDEILLETDRMNSEEWKVYLLGDFKITRIGEPK